MNLKDNVRNISQEAWLPLLEAIFSKMDKAYDKTAEAYGFHCSGCEDSCCLTKFHHHTLLEYLYLRKGLLTLPDRTFEDSMKRAETVIAETAAKEAQGLPVRIMCPLNEEGLCLVYKYRPMICRLHGLAHELKKPGHDPVRGDGCALFTSLTEKTDYITFDRTPFYIEMALLEKKLREETGIKVRLKHTIAEMMLL